ncbi:MAG: glutathione S-transferase [Propionibacteriaceae bacterium]|jgi:putative glutathione S-transferase|nr:glutathione S-transferase [Propionibacteriaceae bacterium]
MTITPDIEAAHKNPPFVEPLALTNSISPEILDDGGFRRQRNWFSGRFGEGEGLYPVESGRYFILGSLGCGWARRQHILLRLLGLDAHVGFYLLTGKDENGWLISPAGNDIKERFGYDHLNPFYVDTDPTYTGRGTSPTVIDGQTGKVVSNDYHLLPQDWETVWAPLHKEGAPDLYPEPLRKEIDLLNQQIFDDINNGTYKVIFAKQIGPARAAFEVFYARLADLDFRLKSRRYLFGDKITDSDVRLFQTLASFERNYRPGIAHLFGEKETKQLWEFENLWAYGRDLFAQGFVDDLELYFLGLLPGESGEYLAKGGFNPKGYQLDLPEVSLARWQEPNDRAQLTGSPFYSGPGGGGSFERWTFA